MVKKFYISKSHTKISNVIMREKLAQVDPKQALGKHHTSRCLPFDVGTTRGTGSI
jgi:hypothetical protein